MADDAIEVASFRIKDEGADLFEIGSVAISCKIDFDRERKEWKAWDDHGNEAWADDKPLAALRVFTMRLEDAG